MKLDELKKMIAEEFESYMKEDDGEGAGGAEDGDLDGGLVPGAGEEQSPEDALEKIYIGLSNLSFGLGMITGFLGLNYQEYKKDYRK